MVCRSRLTAAILCALPQSYGDVSLAKKRLVLRENLVVGDIKYKVREAASFKRQVTHRVHVAYPHPQQLT